jgi:hypothetical protein
MYARVPAPAIIRDDFVQHYVENYEAMYQSRAAVALARINTASAHATLLDALRREFKYREDVRRTIGMSAGAVIFATAGDSQHAPYDSLVRVDPTISIHDSIRGEGLSGVPVAFRVDSGGGVVDRPSQYTDANGNASTSWRLGHADSVNTLSAVAAGQIVRFRAWGHPVR